MTTEQELKQRCTPEIIKKMVELAEGFESKQGGRIGFKTSGEDFCRQHWVSVKHIMDDTISFSILIHRAVEGLGHIIIDNESKHVEETTMCKLYKFYNYQPTTLTHAECAMLDCLLEVLR